MNDRVNKNHARIEEAVLLIISLAGLVLMVCHWS